MVGIAVYNYLTAEIFKKLQKVESGVGSFAPAARNAARVDLEALAVLEGFAQSLFRYTNVFVTLFGHDTEFVYYVEVADNVGFAGRRLFYDHFVIMLYKVHHITAENVIAAIYLVLCGMVYGVAIAAAYNVMNGSNNIIEHTSVYFGIVVLFYAEKNRDLAFIFFCERFYFFAVRGVIFKLHAVACVAGGEAVVGKAERKHIFLYGGLYVFAHGAFAV